MLALNPFDTQLIENFRQFATALIEFTPSHFKTVTCQLTAQPAAGGQTALFYEIGSPQFPDETTTEPGEQVHKAATQLVRHWTAGGQTFPGLRITMTENADGSWENDIQILHADVEDDVEEEQEEDSAAEMEADAECHEACGCAAAATSASKPWWKFW